MKADDPAASLLQHHSGHMTDAVEGSFQIDVNNSGKIFLTHFHEKSVLRNSGIIYQDINTSVFLCNSFEKSFTCIKICHIALQDICLAAGCSISAFVSRAFSSERYN